MPPQGTGGPESARLASEASSSVAVRLLGFGLLLAWGNLVAPFERAHGVEGFSSSLSRLLLILSAASAVLIVAGLYSRAEGDAPLRSRYATVCGVFGALAAVLELAGLALPPMGGTFDVAAILLRSVADAGLFLMWNQLLATYRAKTAWVTYAGSFALAGMFGLLTGYIGSVGVTLCMLVLPAASAGLLVRSMRLPRERCEDEIIDERLTWHFPWRPVILAASFSFAYYLLAHIDGDPGLSSNVGRLVVSMCCLVLFVAAFDRFEASVLAKATAVLVVAGLLTCGADKTGVVAGLCAALTAAGYYGFTLYAYGTLNGICYRFGAPTWWLFGSTQAACLIVGVPASVAGDHLNALVENGWMPTDIVIAATVVVIVTLGFFLLTGDGVDHAWGIKAELDRGEGAQRTGGGQSQTVGYLANRVLRCALVARHYGLTHREEEVLSLMAEGMPLQKIESELYIAHGTLRAHVQHIYAKLGVHSYDEARAVVEGWGG